MKNPFKRKKQNGRNSISEPLPAPAQPAEEAPADAAPAVVTTEVKDEKAPDDGFTEWKRSKVRGGIERRERNDIYEAYSVYGTDGEGRLICRYYHRYPEHERDFGLSYERVLDFDSFNRRLLSELDQGGLTLADYHACIRCAVPSAEPSGEKDYGGFSDEEEAALRAFCDSADILREQSYLHSEGVLSCACRSAVGDDRLILRFRRPLPHDALGKEIPGVTSESAAGYDIDNLWIMGVYNRLRDRCSAVSVTRLTSAWSVAHESLWLMSCTDFDGAGGSLLAAAGEADSFRRFGFWSLDFANK